MNGFVLCLSVAMATGTWLVLAAHWFPRQSNRLPSTLGPLADRLHQAGLHRITAGRFLVGAVVAAAVVGFATYEAIDIPAIAIVVSIGAALLPFGWLSRRAAARRAQMQCEWPEVVDHIIAGIRSGHLIPVAVGMLADTGTVALRDNFRDFRDRYRRTTDWTYSLDALIARCADAHADRVLETLRLAHSLGGGDVVTVLRSLADQLRADASIRSEITARQSWSLNAARLGVTSPWVVLLVMSARPEARLAYASEAGSIVILLGAATTLLAFVIMRRIGSLPEDSRWSAQ